jgi:hypothetical protein
MTLQEHFKFISDYRQPHKVAHPLIHKKGVTSNLWGVAVLGE